MELATPYIWPKPTSGAIPRTALYSKVCLVLSQSLHELIAIVNNSLRRDHFGYQHLSRMRSCLFGLYKISQRRTGKPECAKLLFYQRYAVFLQHLDHQYGCSDVLLHKSKHRYLTTHGLTVLWQLYLIQQRHLLLPVVTAGLAIAGAAILLCQYGST